MRRFALRDLRSDEGLGLIETVVSLMVFALIMSGLAASMIAFAHSTTLSRARAAASSIAQQYTEKARAVGVTQLENCNNQTPAPPSTSQWHNDGVNHAVPQGSDSYCIPYQKSITSDGLTFTLTRLVVTKASNNDVAGQLQTEKYLMVQLAWTDAGGGAKSYELDTIFSQKGSNVSAPAQGIRFVIKDTSGNIITADSANWAVTITGSDGTVYTDQSGVTTAEGTYSQVDLPTGTYTCLAQSTDDASSGYFPGAPPTYNSGMTLSSSTGGGANDTVSSSCTVTANTVTDFVTTWQSSTDCAVSSTTAKAVNVTVTDSSTPPVGLTGMNVVLTQLNDGTKTYPKTTTAGGLASGLKPTANWYVYSVTDPAGNYVMAQNTQTPVCIAAGTTVNLTVPMTLTTTCPTGGANGTLSLTVSDANTGAKLNGYKAQAISASTGTITALSNTNAQGLATKALPPGWYYYMAGPPAGNVTYQGSGAIGPVCIATGVTSSYAVGLRAPTCTRGSGANGKGSLAFTVQDTGGRLVSGATISLLSIDFDTAPAAQPTVNGTYTFQNTVVAGPYQYFVIGPNGSYTPAVSVTPVCAIANSTVSPPTVILQGIVSVAVTVRNNDTVPWKTYRVVIASSDPTTFNPITQYVTVPNCTPGAGCTRNPSAAVTFSGLTTGQYVVTVCAELKNNCNQVDAAPAQSSSTSTTYYPYLTPGTAYTQSTNGYEDLATIDDSGGN